MINFSLRRSLAITGLVVSSVLVLGACGGSEHSSGGGMDMSGQSGMNHDSESMGNQAVVAGAPEIAVEGDAFSFAPERIVLGAGEDVTIVLTAADISHDFYVDGIGHIVHAGAAKTAKGGLVIDKPGNYQFWCTVKGHKKDGMVGTLTVTA